MLNRDEKVYILISTNHDITFLIMSIGTFMNDKDCLNEAIEFFIKKGYEFLSTQDES